jgi:hypothetical protein
MHNLKQKKIYILTYIILLWNINKKNNISILQFKLRILLTIMVNCSFSLVYDVFYHITNLSYDRYFKLIILFEFELLYYTYNDIIISSLLGSPLSTLSYFHWCSKEIQYQI